jgi:hypothetical protein
MDSTRATRSHGGLVSALAAAALAMLAACGGGGGGSSDLRVKSTIFGFDPFTGNFDASGQQGEAPLIPQNMCLVFDFSANLNPASVSTQSIVVQELDTSVSPPAPGPLAAATFQVAGSRLIICPLITFTDTNVSYGFNPSKTYQVLFQVAPATTIVTSTDGKGIKAADRGPYVFRTSTTIFDQIPGAPKPTMLLLDHATGAVLSPAAAPFKPVPDVQITFNEPVLPPTAVDPGGVGTSPSIHVELDGDGDPTTNNDRTTLPGFYSLNETDSNAVVTWHSALSEIPTDQPVGLLYVITVDGTVQDLAGNSKISETNDPGANDVFTFITIPGNPNTNADPLIEPFDNQDNSDDSVTSAKWGTAVAGFLTAGVGGGTGKDGAFDPSQPSFQTSPPTDITVNVGTKTVTMGTVSSAVPGTPRVYEFTSFTLPAGWSAVANGKFALQIECSGNVTVSGILDASGAAGAVYTGGQVGPGAGALGAFGGANGGGGGSTTDANAVDTFFPGKVGANPNYPSLAFFAPAVGNPNQGTSGRNTAITSFTLTDGYFTTNLNNLTSTFLWIQPNIAADDYRFERNHPAFRVTSIAGGVVTVDSDPNSPTYFGAMDQETQNPYLESDGAGGFHPPILGQIYDPYVIGELTGKTGSSLFDLDENGTADNFTFLHGGSGSLSQTVMQTFLTLGRSGGGGGGGSVAPGSNGQDDPTFDNGPGSFGGTGVAGGAGGAAAPTSTFLSKVDADTFKTATALFDDGTGNPDNRFVGHLINPNTSQGNTFEILAVNAVDTVTILPITTSGGATIDLDSTTLAIGHTVRVTPPYIVGGTGGGGSGVHCAGSSKNPAGHKGHPPLLDPDGNHNLDNQTGSRPGFYDDDGPDANPLTQDGKEDTSEAIFTLPHWIPGAGGGAGGGSIKFVTAGSFSISSTGLISAEGGEGGRSDVIGSTAASGGGGGAGGSVFVGAGSTVSVSVGGLISCAGGPGGAKGFAIEGGDGAPGRVRLENALGNLSVSNFIGATVPPMTAEFLGTFPGGGESLAQSKFMASGVLVPLYQQIKITMRVTENGVVKNGVTYVVNRDGTIDPSSYFTTVPPFDLSVSYTTGDPQTGNADLNNATPFNDPTTDPMSNHDGLAFVRFKIILADASVPVVIGGKDYTDIRVDSVEIDLKGAKP